MISHRKLLSTSHVTSRVTAWSACIIIHVWLVRTYDTASRTRAKFLIRSVYDVYPSWRNVGWFFIPLLYLYPPLHISISSSLSLSPYLSPPISKYCHTCWSPRDDLDVWPLTDLDVWYRYAGEPSTVSERFVCRTRYRTPRATWPPDWQRNTSGVPGTCGIGGRVSTPAACSCASGFCR